MPTWIRSDWPAPIQLMPRRSDWTRSRPSRDVTAGLMVGLVALPLALGFGVSSGLGAGAGLVTAIVAGTLAAIFGGSPSPGQRSHRRHDRRTSADHCDPRR